MYVYHNTLHDTTKAVYGECQNFVCEDPTTRYHNKIPQQDTTTRYHTYTDINGKVIKEYFIPFRNMVLRSPAFKFTR